jgi:hypothetical protein
VRRRTLPLIFGVDQASHLCDAAVMTSTLKKSELKKINQKLKKCELQAVSEQAKRPFELLNLHVPCPSQKHGRQPSVIGC